MGLVTEVDSEHIIDRLLKIIRRGSIGRLNHHHRPRLVTNGTLPEALRIPNADGAFTVVYDGYSRVTSVMLATLVYAVPFLVASVMTLRKGRPLRLGPADLDGARPRDPGPSWRAGAPGW